MKLFPYLQDVNDELNNKIFKFVKARAGTERKSGIITHSNPVSYNSFYFDPLDDSFLRLYAFKIDNYWAITNHIFIRRWAWKADKDTISFYTAKGYPAVGVSKQKIVLFEPIKVFVRKANKVVEKAFLNAYVTDNKNPEHYIVGKQNITEIDKRIRFGNVIYNEMDDWLVEKAFLASLSLLS